MMYVLVYDGKADIYENVLKESGLPYKRYKSLKNIFEVEAPEGHEVLRNEYVKAAENPQLELSQSIPMDGTVKYDGPNPTEPWPLLNITRRNPYGETQRAETTFSADYKTKRTGRGVDIYMFDSGIIHPCSDYVGRTANLDGSTDTYFGIIDEEEGFSYPVMQHGSWCTSHAAGNTLGVARDAFVWSIPVIITQPLPGLVSFGLVAQGVDDVLTHYNARAHLNRPAVSNFSLGGKSYYELYTELLQQLMDAGIVVVTAATNAMKDMDLEGEDWGPVESHPHTIGVGSVDHRREPMYLRPGGGTNSGTWVVTYAPGQWVLGLAADQQGNDVTTVISGTSFATPYTTGVIACMLQGYNRLNSMEQVVAVKHKLIENTMKGLIVSHREPYLEEGDSLNIVHNQLTYLDPNLDFEEIPLLTRNSG